MRSKTKRSLIKAIKFEPSVKPHPFRDPNFRPSIRSMSDPILRRQIEHVIERYDLTGSAAAAEQTEVTGLPDGGMKDYILQRTDTGAAWTRKLTVTNVSPDDLVGSDGDIWIEVQD